MSETLSVTEIVGLAFGSSVVAALLTQTMSWWRDHRAANREARYLALRLATTFERLAEDAATVLGRIKDHENSKGAFGEYTSRLPKLHQLPDASERWRELPVTLTAEVLGFEPYWRSVQSGIDQLIEIAGDPEAYEEVKVQCARLGCRALEIAGKLRTSYTLPPLQANHDWPAFLHRGM